MIRKLLDLSYPALSRLIFIFTSRDPEKAHSFLEKVALNIAKYNFGRFLRLPNKMPPDFSLSLAAGFDKNAVFPTDFYGWLGVNRIVIGTVTAEKWSGNLRPRVARFVAQRALVNWMGLPNDGIVAVLRRLHHYQNSVPVTLSLALSPDIAGDSQAELLEIEKMLRLIEAHPLIDRLEFNLSCPNVEHNLGLQTNLEDYRRYLHQLLLKLVAGGKKPCPVFLKISPDMTKSQLDILLELSDKLGITGFTIANSTKSHKFHLPNNPDFKGGASGDFLYQSNLKLLMQVLAAFPERFKLIFCGGLSNRRKFNQLLDLGITDFQLYTPLIYYGPGLISQLVSLSQKYRAIE